MVRHRKDYNLLSLSAESCESVVKDFNDLDELCANFLYADILKAVKKVIADDKIDFLRNLSIVLTEISKSKNDECLKNYQYPDRNENFNLVSLACKNKAVKALNYIFSEKPQTLYNVSIKLTGVCKNELLFSITDEFRHNAFYYAIRSNMTDLLSILVNKWQSEYSDEELDDLLSQNYKELKLRNVSMTGEMKIFVQSKILDLRFFHANRCENSGTGNSWEQIKKRIKLVLTYIRTVKNDYWDKDPDVKFILIAEFIAKNIHVLKSLLKSTYDRLPWEEIEFCLTVFIRCCKSSSRQNLVYNCVLNKKQLLMHLFNFSVALGSHYEKFENNNVKKLAKSVNLPRDCVIAKIIENNSEFRELYDDFEKIRDFCSLEIIKSYANLIESSDVTEKRIHLLVSRVLQVMGEHLKNTLDSPKLSASAANVLLSSLSLETTEILTKLRDALSHEETLFIRSEIEKKTYLFKNILTNISRIQDMIPDMLHTMSIASVKILLKKVKLCESAEDIKGCYGPYRQSLDLYSKEIEKIMLIKGDFERLEEFFLSLSKYINDEAISEKILYDQIHQLIQGEKQRNEDLKWKFHFNVNFASILHLNPSEKSFLDLLANFIVDIPLETPAKKTKQIGKLLEELFVIVSRRIIPAQNEEVNSIIKEGIFFFFYEMGSVKWIEQFRDIINENKISIMCRKSNKKSHKQTLSLNLSEKLLTSKFSQLKEELIDFNLKDGTSYTDFSYFESNKELQAVTEMLVLDILCLLENSCSRNPFFFDSDFPVLTGKNLRNHLAHRNTLIDVCLEESSAQLFVNIKKFLTAVTSNNDKEIDKIIKCDCFKLGTSIEYDLRIISNQQKLFFALEEGNMTDVEECVKEGADIYGKDCNSSTCLHFAGKAPDCAALEWVLKQGLDINSKDCSGQTVFHTAAKFKRIEVIRYLVERIQMSLDISEENGKTPLHFAGKEPDIAALKWILEKDLNINSNKNADEIASHIAAKLKRIEEKQYLVERKHMYLNISDVNGKTPLHVAVENQSNNVVEYVSKLAINAIAKDKNRLCALWIAICRHNIDAATILLENEENVNEIKAYCSFSLLHMAAISGNIVLVKLLITKKHRTDSKNEFGQTPLHFATVVGNFEIVKVLVVNGADVNAKDEAGYTPLINAAGFGSLEIVAFLLENGADINVSNLQELTPLFFPVFFRHATVTELLLQKGAFVNSKEITGFTPLHVAAWKDHYEIVELLLKHNAMIDIKNNTNLTALHLSASTGHKEVVELLIKEGAEINTTNSTKSTPLHEAAAAGHRDIVDILIDEGADINFKNESGATALHLAASNADRGIVESLLKKGADIRASEADKVTPLYLLITRGLSDLLTPEGRDVNSSDAIGFTLLHAAASAGDQTLVEYCIENSCDINARSNSGLTALHLAAQGNHHKIVRLLLNEHAELDAKDDDGYTPLWFAVNSNCIEAVGVLVSHEIKDCKPNIDDKIMALRLSVSLGYYKIVDILLQNFKFDISYEIKHRLLNIAINKGNNNLVVTLLKRGCEINGDINGHTPLDFAVASSQHYMVELLLSKGANPNLLDKQNSTPLDTAVIKGDAEIIEILLSEKADIRITDEFILQAADYAVALNKLDIIKLLLQMKVIDADARGKSGFTLLHTSALVGSLDVTRYLVAEGADINAKDKENRKPVHIAAEKGYKDMVEFYLNSNDFGDETTALLLVAARNGHANICEFLIERIACHKRVFWLQSLLCNALLIDHKELLLVSLNYGTFYNGRSTSLLKPIINNGAFSLLRKVKSLFTAVRNNTASEVKTLLREGNNPKYCIANAKCVRMETVLHYASWRGYEEIVDILLKHNTNLNAQTRKGDTPLHYAVKFSHFSIVKALLSNGAIYNALAQTGKAPLDYATDREIRDFFNFLNNIFTKVQDKDLSVLEDLRGKDEVTMRSVIKAKNVEGKTLIDVAYIYSFPKTDELEMLFKTDLVPELKSVKKLELEYKFVEALLALDNILNKSVAIFGTDSHPVLDVKVYFAKISYRCGNLDKALNLLREVLEIRKNSLGEDHLKTLSDKTWIAKLLSKQGNTQEALKIFEALRIKLKEKLEPDDLEMILFEEKFCKALIETKKFDEAIKINDEVEQKCAEKKEVQYRIVLASMRYDRALILTQQQNLFQALKLFTTVYETRRDIFTLHDLSTVRALSGVAEILVMLDILDESLKMFEEVLDIQKSFLPENHFDILQTEFNIGKVLSKQGMFLSALKICFALEPKIAVVAPNSGLMKANKDIIEIIKNNLSAFNFRIDELLNKIVEDN